MITKITLLLTLIAFTFIVSQSLMYILALKEVQLKLGVESFIEFRKLIDISMRATFKYAIYGALLMNITLLVLNVKQPSGMMFITAAIALVALVIDILLTTKGSLPINDVINAWSPDNYPANWTEYRTKWLSIFQYRQIANITGFVSLLVGAVFGSR